MNIWVVMVAGGLLTYAIRLSFIYLYGKIHIPAWFHSSLRFVPPAVLSAIILPELTYHAGRLDISAGNDRLVAGLIAIAVGWWTRNLLLTLLAGMTAVLLLSLF